MVVCVEEVVEAILPLFIEKRKHAANEIGISLANYNQVIVDGVAAEGVFYFRIVTNDMAIEGVNRFFEDSKETCSNFKIENIDLIVLAVSTKSVKVDINIIVHWSDVERKIEGNDKRKLKRKVVIYRRVVVALRKEGHREINSDYL